MIDDEQVGFRAGRRRCVDQIFTLKQIGAKARKKKRRAYADDLVLYGESKEG